MQVPLRLIVIKGDREVTAAGEARAYQAEIDYANSIGRPDIADQIAALRDQRIAELMGGA